jgi:RNA polymerase sigma factor (sigma-70 family)
VDHASFEAVYEGQRLAAIRLATMLTGSRALAEEIVQDVFLRVHERWHEVVDPPAYVRRSVVNACRSHRRSAERSARREAQVALAEVAPSAERDDGLRAALRALPEHQRAVLVLRYFEDLPDEEIARLLGCRRATVRSTARRALQQLREVVR